TSTPRIPRTDSCRRARRSRSFASGTSEPRLLFPMSTRIAPSSRLSSRRPLPNPPSGLPRVAPHIFYADVGAAANWLADAFGFACRLRITDGAGLVVHAEIEVYEGLVMLGLAREHAHWASPRELDGRMTHRLFVYVDDVDAHHARAAA